jgi:hypothetical protein
MNTKSKLLPFAEVKLITSKLNGHAKLKKGTEAEIRILEKCLLFAEH